MNSEIERLAQEAGFSYFDRISPDLRSMDPRYAKFAALVAEDCAKECDRFRDNALSAQKVAGSDDLSDVICRHHACAYSEASAAIRAKFALSHEAPEAK